MVSDIKMNDGMYNLDICSCGELIEEGQECPKCGHSASIARFNNVFDDMKPGIKKILDTYKKYTPAAETLTGSALLESFISNECVM